ncbi:GTP-binding protein REM 1 [Spodoptera frugiperda]|uniref:GTP-binding protein REM 1 n=1 Tax=Spodoptera frugiperda TaxID=7108 RepID=A0A9R0D9A5_SPOFR|nr:GTP-binding protein REM 1 [Spodoptera frugiperda]
MATDGRTKRSQSICAPASASMEALAAPMETTPAPRRRPAARSQSARITGGRSVRQRRQQQQQQQLDRETRTRYSSEPRLAEAETPPQVRRQASARRRPPPGQHNQPRRSNAFLDVPRNPPHQPEEEPDEDSYRLRTFNITQKGGIVNRGDSFRRRRSRSGSLAPSSPAQSAPESQERKPVACHRVAMIGAPGVGKTALISQFQTSECINAYDRQRDLDSTEQKVSIMLNGEESELYFVNCTTTKEEIERSEPPDAFVVIYSVVDKASFQKAEQELARLLDCDMLRSRPAILVANKIDLARSRAVSTQDGKCLACTYKAKFIEVSVGINHNVDELLVGILNQIRLKKQQYTAEGGRESSPAHWYKSRGVVRASMKARQMFTWIFGKEDSKFKNCENLNVL